jgi:SnoaL-like domain
MHEGQIAAFRTAVEAGDSDAVLATFADDITFCNPVTFRPFEGKQTMAVVIPPLLEVWKDLHYVGELRGDGIVGLVFDARVGNRDARGIDLIRLGDDGLIAEITVMVRPLSGLQALAAEMEAALASGGPRSRSRSL